MLLMRNWWVLALRGISFLIFGLYFFIYPELTTMLLARAFVFYAAVDGAICLLIGLRTHDTNSWKALFGAIGLLDFLVAGLGLYQPLLLEVLLFTTFGPFMIVIGILEVAAAGLLWNKFVGTRWMAALGLVAFLLGLLITVQPLTGFAAVEDLIGLAQIVRGVIWIATALSLREKRYDLRSNAVTDL
jgi:uncharacterized membrane protein HdeD (DUF308 family)